MQRVTTGVPKSSSGNVEKYPLVEVTRVLNAPVEDVWRAWTSPDLIRQWWGPSAYSCPVARLDLKEGGKYLYAMKGPDGKIQYSGGVFEEVEKNARIICTDTFMDQDGNEITPEQAGMPGDWADRTAFTVSFESRGDNQTRIHIAHEGIPKAIHDECVQGWTESIDKFQRVVETI